MLATSLLSSTEMTCTMFDDSLVTSTCFPSGADADAFGFQSDLDLGQNLARIRIQGGSQVHRPRWKGRSCRWGWTANASGSEPALILRSNSSVATSITPIAFSLPSATYTLERSGLKPIPRGRPPTSIVFSTWSVRLSMTVTESPASFVDEDSVGWFGDHVRGQEGGLREGFEAWRHSQGEAPRLSRPPGAPRTGASPSNSPLGSIRDQRLAQLPTSRESCEDLPSGRPVRPLP